MPQKGLEHMKPAAQGHGEVVLFLAVMLCALWAMSMPETSVAWQADVSGPTPHMGPSGADGNGDMLRIRSARGGPLWVSAGPHRPFECHDDAEVLVRPGPYQALTAGLVSMPTAVQWRPPLPMQPSAALLRTMESDEVGRMGPARIHTRLQVDHGVLPVFSLWLPEGALFDPDTGIYVVGNAMLRATPLMRDLYKEDGRWWKYPGNFHFRGRTWERKAHLQVITSDGQEMVQTPVGLRIHGNMTRGFPQKSLRLLFRKPLAVPLFNGGVGVGSHALVLRAGGNDQPKALMRDALLNEAFVDAAFEVSRARTCVVYVNGAYWGLHHLRQRIDEKELGRRHGLPADRIAVIELELATIHGEEGQAALFREHHRRIVAWNGSGTAFLDSLSAILDVDGLLAYMAALMVHGNQDWPERNVKIWRYTGPRGVGKPLDGRWYFILSDSDLALGSFMPASEGLFQRVDRTSRHYLSAIFLAMMRSPQLQARFMEHVDERLREDLENGRLLALIEEMAAHMAPEMGRHTARWRKPADKPAWERHVEDLRRYVRERGPALRRDLARNSLPTL